MDERLKRIVDYAYETVPLYREKEIDISENTEILDIPVISKDEVIIDWEKAISRECLMKYINGRMLSSWTSGSTGKCLRVLWHNEQFNESLLPLWILRYKYYGINTNDRFCYFYHHANCEQKEKNDVIYETYRNSLGFSKQNMTEGILVSIIEMMQEFQPKWLMLQPSIALYLANVMNRYDIKSINSVKMIEMSGEMLSKESRSYIKKVFQCEIADQYGCGEVNSIAYECPCGNMHCLSSNVYVEVVHDGKVLEDGLEGEICITSLVNYAMPLIRYLVGDRGILWRKSSCECGQTGDILKLTAGRVGTEILYRDGLTSTPYIFMNAIEAVILRLGEIIIQFRVIQKEYDYFNVLLVLTEDAYYDLDSLTESIEDTFLQNIFENKLENSVFEFVYLDRIVCTENYRKFNYFESDIER